MKALLTILALAPFASGSSSTIAVQDPQPAATADAAEAKATDEREAVHRAGLDYVEALYDAKPKLIERSVHPDLVKLGFYRSKPDQPYHQTPMTFAQLVALAAKWNKDGEQTDADSPKQVEVLDVLDQTAAVKVTAVWGIDYMQLAKFEGRWKIVHILWQSHPEKE